MKTRLLLVVVKLNPLLKRKPFCRVKGLLLRLSVVSFFFLPPPPEKKEAEEAGEVLEKAVDEENPQEEKEQLAEALKVDEEPK